MKEWVQGDPFCGLLNISALHVQYEIQAFAKFKRPENSRMQNQNHWKRLRIAEYIVSQSLTVRIGETTPSYFQHF